ncbi:MAG TPA: fused MFS/spermidine synthase [Chthoniobacter sp.]|nr:fused MFS/spermidine synthase [Chthoniobacter sp.]
MSNGEKVLVARHSAFQPILLTENELGLRTLRFGADGVSQSVVKASDPRHLALAYARVLPASLAFVPDPRRILIVGLGGGSLPRFFHSHFPETAIDVVELDGEVVEVAKAYCGFVEDARLRVHVEDGRDFIDATRESYDIIILDCFDAESIPQHLATLEFLGRVRSTLSSGGMVVANIWGRSSNPLYGPMLTTYRAAFEDVYIFDVPQPGSKLFVSLPFKQLMTRDTVVERAGEMGRRHHFTYDLSAEVFGFRNSDFETIRAGAILRD